MDFAYNKALAQPSKEIYGTERGKKKRKKGKEITNKHSHQTIAHSLVKTTPGSLMVATVANR